MTQHHPLPVIFKKILHKRKVKENGTSYNLTIRMFKQKMDILEQYENNASVFYDTSL